MAFNRSAAPARNAAPQADSNFTKANAFLNIGINGKKLVGVPMYEGQAEHAQLMAWLNPTGPDAEATAALHRQRLTQLLDSLTITYVPVSAEPKKFDLPE